jgi:hypothetical protein
MFGTAVLGVMGSRWKVWLYIVQCRAMQANCTAASTAHSAVYIIQSPASALLYLHMCLLDSAKQTTLCAMWLACCALRQLRVCMAACRNGTPKEMAEKFIGGNVMAGPDWHGPLRQRSRRYSRLHVADLAHGRPQQTGQRSMDYDST